LGEHDALWAEEDYIRWAKACLDLLNAPNDRLRLHDHPGTPAVRSIVRDVVTVCGKIPQVVQIHLE
jgi:hypothetical protein